MSASPPLSSESFTFFRTSFHERKVLSRETFATSCRIRKMRSSVLMEREPRREACSVHCRSWERYQDINETEDEVKPYHFDDLLSNYLFDHTRGFWGGFSSLTRDIHHLEFHKIRY